MMHRFFIHANCVSGVNYAIRMKCGVNYAIRMKYASDTSERLKRCTFSHNNRITSTLTYRPTHELHGRASVAKSTTLNYGRPF